MFGTAAHQRLSIDRSSTDRAVASSPATNFFVGLDFGTSGTGYAYKTTRGDVRTVDNWPGQLKSYCKNLTALLYDTNTCQVVAYGWDAYKRYIGIKDSNQQQQYLYLEKFKLALADRGDRVSALAVVAVTDTTDIGGGLPPQLTPQRVVGDCLRFMKEHALRTLRRAYGDDIQLLEIAWALTVPTGWSEASKQIMRLAAKSAGIVDNADSPLLMLVHEPEAAAVAVVSNLQNPVPLQEHDTLIVIDAGGGTTDITSHKVVRRERLVLEEATHKEGEMVGAALLDEMMKHLLAVRLPHSVWADWKDKHANHLVKLVHDVFESQKCSFDGTAPMKLGLPRSLLKMMPEQALCDLAEHQEGTDDELWISVEDSKAMFDKPIDVIIAAAKRVLKRVGGRCDYMLLVGGFGESEYLNKRVRAAFSSVVNRRIVQPDRASAAVVKGATMYAEAPDTIFSRRSRYRYGLKVSRDFAPGLRQDLKYTDATTGKDYCSDCFDSLIELDQLVEHNQVVTSTLCAIQKYQSAVRFPIYSCTNNTDRYTDCESMKRLGSMRITIDNPIVVQNPDKYTFTVTFTFGSVELKVMATDDQTKRQAKTQVLFVAD